MEINEKLALDVSEAAALIGVSRPTMYAIMNRPDFNASFKIGKRTKISKKKFEIWIEAQAEGRCTM